jgi:hypothetical protein
MAYQRLQVGRALPITPNDNFEIPQIAAIQNSVSGTSTPASGPTGNFLADSTKNFPALGVEVGDIVVAGNEVYTVIGLTGTTFVEISGSTDVNAGTPYTIYRIAEGIKNNGCTLYVGLAGNLTVQTVGGDVVQFTGVPTGSFLPVQVLKVMSTGTDAQNIVALW